MNKLVKVLVTISAFATGQHVFAADLNIGEIPEIKSATTIPTIVSKKNEVPIAKSFADANPNTVLGKFVNTKTGDLLFLEDYLSDSSNPKVEVKTEQIFRNLVEKGVAASASYLGAVSASLDDKTLAEVSLTKNSFVSVSSKDIKTNDIKTRIAKFKNSEIEDYGLVIGYTDYIVTATFFTASGKKAEAKGFGANVGGKWYSKSENTSTDRTVVALFTPLKILVPVLNKDPKSSEPLLKSLDSAIKGADIKSIKELKSVE